MRELPRYLVRCVGCKRATSKKYAACHAGLCKTCADPKAERTHERPVCHAEQTHAFRSLEADLDSCPW